MVRKLMNNQWGQNIEVGDIVGYVNKTGSYTERKIGTVTGFGTRDRGYGVTETTLHVTWAWEASYGPPEERVIKGTVGLRRVFRLDPGSLHPYLVEGLQRAAEGAK